MSKKLIIGNWKCNPLKTSEALKIFNDIKSSAENSKTSETIICPPNIFLKDLLALKTKIKIGAQNCFWEKQGAYTGEVSAGMLKNMGCKYVIIGHSERRKINKETNEEINKKIISVLENKLIPIFCFGENREERENEKTFDVLKNQIQEGIDKIAKPDIAKIIFAYEPIWSIGSGNFAAPEQIKEVRDFIIRLLSQKIGKENIGKIKIIYGGSVNAENTPSYFNQAQMDGVLVGGMSLKPIEFSKIIKSA
ncbi:MAG: triose-phosphate isomerase [Candidatus Paceibacterota bacterium]